MRYVHWFDFETYIKKNGDTVPVKVEVTISSDKDNIVDLEGFKVKLVDGDTELVLSNEQVKDVTVEIWERINDAGAPVIDEPGSDWRNEWE